jgi:ADP-heptose:LPS heptosyltransferase
VLNLAGASLDHTANYLAAADAFVGNDSGMLHVAAALAVPSVGIFGPSNPGIWLRAYPLLRVVSAGHDCDRGAFSQARHRQGEVSCETQRCTYAYDPAQPSYPVCLQAVTVEDVLQQVRGVLGYAEASSTISSDSSR